MGVVTRVLGSHTGFVLAIACHCCPTELQGQQNQQKNRQVPSHSLNFSDSNFSKSPGIYLSPWRLRSIKKDSDALASVPIYVYPIRLFIVCKLTIICGWPLLAVCGHFCRIWEFFLSRTLSAFRIHCRLTLVLFV